MVFLWDEGMKALPMCDWAVMCEDVAQWLELVFPACWQRVSPQSQCLFTLYRL